jgi:hypothetical protein
MDTSGFYKLENGTNLLHGPNFVEHKDWQLYKHLHETYEYPVDGWYWFNSKEEAHSFFNYTEPTQPPFPTEFPPQP